MQNKRRIPLFLQLQAKLIYHIFDFLIRFSSETFVIVNKVNPFATFTLLFD